MAHRDAKGDLKRDRNYPPKPGRTLIVGSRLHHRRRDRREDFPDCVGVDREAGEGVDVVIDLEEPECVNELGLFYHVECASVLEHSPRPWLICRHIEQMLHVGGTLYIQAPFAWRMHDYGGDYFRFTPDGIKAMFDSIKWKIAKVEPRQRHRIRCDNQVYIARQESVCYGFRS